MSTKAQTLKTLSKGKLQPWILPMEIITRRQFMVMSDGHSISSLDCERFAVRSSSLDEDQEISNAGKYLTLLDVTRSELYQSIEKVFESYTSRDGDDEVLIQPYLSDVKRSGVVFTRDPTHGGDYLIINSHLGSDTTAVTSGQINGKLEVIFRPFLAAHKTDINDMNNSLLKLIDLLALVQKDLPLNIEFAETPRGIFLLQVRRLHINYRIPNSELVSKALAEISDSINLRQSADSFLLGSTTYFGNMPDWNPAELIGITPSKLSITLFKELITNEIWVMARQRLGYRVFAPIPLLVEYGGQPYIDVRASFNSFLPNGLNEETSTKLVNYYLSRFQQSPWLHDKIESEIIFSCYEFNLSARLKELSDIFTIDDQEAIVSSLTSLTRSIIRNDTFSLKEICFESDKLNYSIDKITSSKASNLEKIRQLVVDCKGFGTLPFAAAARLAFIATSLVQSLVSAGVFTNLEIERFMKSNRTVTSQMMFDYEEINLEDFINKYGHLRPGTFDLRIPNFRDGLNSYFHINQDRARNFAEVELDIAHFIEKLNLSGLLEPLQINAKEFFTFVQESIEAREQIKFLFTRHVSKILDLIAENVIEMGYEPEDIAHLDIEILLNSELTGDAFIDLIHANICSNKESFLLTRSLNLPPVIFSPLDVYRFEFPDSRPNFITQNCAHGELINLKDPQIDLKGKILLIESADPGFDWIFTRGIIGLITCFGGANSHIAVRANELNIPAVLGVGKLLFEELKNCKSVFIDCSNKRLDYL
jgi:phosphohistidine swiveling domain-containing protein